MEDVEDSEYILSDLLDAICAGVYSDTSTVWYDTVKMNAFMSYDRIIVMENCA